MLLATLNYLDLHDTEIKGTSNYLAEFEKKTIETASQILLNFLHDLRGILPEIDKICRVVFLLEYHKHNGT